MPEDNKSEEIQSPNKKEIKREFASLEEELARLEQELKQRLGIDRLTIELKLKQEYLLENERSDETELRLMEEQSERLKKNIEIKKICMSEKSKSNQTELQLLEKQLKKLNQRLAPLSPKGADTADERI